MSELIPVERLTQPSDVFRCTPLNATISARTCLARRGAKYTGGRTLGHAPKEHTAFIGCQSCELGAQVAARVQVNPKLAPCSVCGVPVKGAKGREPRCPAHRGQGSIGKVA